MFHDICDDNQCSKVNDALVETLYRSFNTVKLTTKFDVTERSNINYFFLSEAY